MVPETSMSFDLSQSMGVVFGRRSVHPMAPLMWEGQLPAALPRESGPILNVVPASSGDALYTPTLDLRHCASHRDP